MSKDQQKTSVLNKLREQTSPVALPKLLEGLELDYSARAVRRWVDEWVKKGIVHKTGKKSGTRYLAIENKPLEPRDIHFSPESLKAIKQIKAPYELRKQVEYQPKWLTKYRPNIDFYLSSTQREKLDHVGNRAKNFKAAGTYARQIYNRLLIDLSYNSSRLEGNTYSLQEAEKLIMEGAETPGKLDEEKTMILNHKDAIRFLVDHSDQAEINEEAICNLHFLLSDGLVSSQYAGKVRDYGVRIGTSTYIPLENPELLHKYLKMICTKANQITNPFEKSIFLLAHIAYLQAFVDVNKRTARLSANLPLTYANLVPLSFDAIKKNDYIDAMIVIYELNNIKPLADIYMHSYKRAAEQYDATVGAIGFDRVRVQYKQQRREIMRHVVTNKLRDSKMKGYIDTEVSKFADPSDQKQLASYIREDLEQLGSHNIAGMGITIEQIQEWREGK
jgi:Fic family protein